MPNSLGSLGSFQAQPPAPGQLTGMRYAPDVTPAPPVKVGPQPPVEGAEQKPAPPVPVRRSPEQIAELIQDCGQAITRLEKAVARGQSSPELVVDIKTKFLNLVLAELLAIEREKARTTLESLYAERWRRFARLETDRFATVDNCRRQMSEVVTSRPEDFTATCRRIFDEIKDRFPAPDPVCQAQGS